MLAHSSFRIDDNLVATVATIDRYVKMIVSQQTLDRSMEVALIKALLSLQQDFSQVEVECALNPLRSNVDKNTLAYIFAHQLNQYEVHRMLKEDQTIDVNIVIKGFIDGGDFNHAEKLIKSGLVTPTTLSLALERFGYTWRARIVQDSAMIVASVAKLYQLAHDDNHPERTALLVSLRGTISDYTGTNNPINPPGHVQFIELCRVYRNINASQCLRFHSSNQMLEDLAKVDPFCLDILSGKTHSVVSDLEVEVEETVKLAL